MKNNVNVSVRYRYIRLVSAVHTRAQGGPYSPPCNTGGLGLAYAPPSGMLQTLQYIMWCSAYFPSGSTVASPLGTITLLTITMIQTTIHRKFLRSIIHNLQKPVKGDTPVAFGEEISNIIQRIHFNSLNFAFILQFFDLVPAQVNHAF